MADVFISFSSKDARRVQEIHARLVERGLDVWWMNNIAPGDSAIREVSRELEGAKKVVLAWSRHAAESPYVEGEIMHAFGTRKLLPVRIEKWSWPAFLSSVQYIDMAPGDDETEAWRKLEDRLQAGFTGSDVGISTPHFAVPQSAGPVRAIAGSMLVLVLALLGALWVAFDAVTVGNVQILQALQFGLIALPILALAPVLIALQRVWVAWQSRPQKGAGQ